MNSILRSIAIQNHYVNFHMKYTTTHMSWFQFIKKKINTEPILIYIYEDKVILFIDPITYHDVLKRWNKYLKFCGRKPHFHLRFIEYSQDLGEIIKNWYTNIKNLKVSVDFINNSYQINLNAPENLRHFLIGRNGREIEMLVSFLDNCISGNFQYSLKIK